MSVLEIVGLKKSFQAPVLSGSLSLKSAEQVAVTGPSGCGKSTLLHLVAGILTPDEGTIKLAGTEITALDETQRDRFRAAHMGYVFQTFHLLESMTALENVELVVTFAGRSDYGRARELLCEMGLEDALDKHPSQLSVGQRQRVAVARALVNEPPLVLADEPTASLDLARAKQVVALLRKSCRDSGAALLMACHDDRVVEAFDKVVDFAACFGGAA